MFPYKIDIEIFLHDTDKNIINKDNFKRLKSE